MAGVTGNQRVSRMHGFRLRSQKLIVPDLEEFNLFARRGGQLAQQVVRPRRPVSG
jgi:hypothetical protein